MTTANVSCYITEHTAASSAHKPTTTIICLLGELLKKCDAVWRVAVHKARTPPAACPPQSPRPFPALQANTALLAHLRRQRANRGRHADDTRQPHLLSAAQVESHLQVPLCKGRKHGALRPQKPLRLIRDGEVGGSGNLYLTPTRYAATTTRMTLH